MRRVAAALLLAVAVVGGTGVADHALSGPERLSAPAEGDMVATTLSDGAPVFVTRDGEGGASVISAVSVHLLHPVHWCADEELFVEPIAATYYDRQGRWVNGPAAAGLARYDAELDADGATILVGDLGDPQPRAERTDVSQHIGLDGCVSAEGEFAGLPPAIPEETLAPDQLSGLVGERVAVDARVHVDEGGMRLCAYGRQECGSEALTLASTWWPGYLDGVRGWADGRYLVFVQGPGRVSELAAARRPEDAVELARSSLRETRERPATMSVRGALLTFDAEAGTATFADLAASPGEHAELLPAAEADGTLTLTLQEDVQPVVEHTHRWLHYYPHEFERAVEAAGGGVPVEASITEEGEVRALTWLRAEP